MRREHKAALTTATGPSGEGLKSHIGYLTFSATISRKYDNARDRHFVLEIPDLDP